MKKITEVLDQKIDGLVYGNRVLLPFRAEILKIIIGKKIITNFGTEPYGAQVRISDDFTGIYFLGYKDLELELSDYDVIKIVLVQKGEDIFNFDNHFRIVLKSKGKHLLSIEKNIDDLMFFE
jgi:hypothetical protein